MMIVIDKQELLDLITDIKADVEDDGTALTISGYDGDTGDVCIIDYKEIR